MLSAASKPIEPSDVAQWERLRGRWEERGERVREHHNTQHDNKIATLSISTFDTVMLSVASKPIFWVSLGWMPLSQVREIEREVRREREREREREDGERRRDRLWKLSLAAKGLFCKSLTTFFPHFHYLYLTLKKESLDQGSLAEGEGSVQLTSLYQLV